MSLAAAAFYGVCSGSLSFINKLAVTTYEFRFPAFLLLMQMIVTACVLKFLKLIRKINLEGWSIETGWSCAVPSLFYAFNSVFALTALSDLNIPMYNVIKRCGPLVNIILAACFLKEERPTWKIVASVFIITSGCIIAGFGDMDFNIQAYLSGVVSILSQALYLTFVQKLNIEEQHSALHILYINSINCIPLFMLYVAISREMVFAVQYLQSCSVDFYAIFLTVICMGCILNYSMFLCTTMNSALTTSIVGVVKSVISTTVGMFTFGGVQPTFLIITGIFMNTVGGIWYAYLKYRAKLNSKVKTEQLGSVP